MNLIVAAMSSEIEYYINKSSLIEEKPFSLYKNDNNLIIISGIGKVNASSALTYALTKFTDIKTIINIGFVGGYKPLEQKDIVIVKDAQYHDFDLTFFGYEKGQVPKMPKAYSTEQNYLNKFKYKEVSLYTGDTFMTEEVISGNEIIADMEGTALYQVAHIFNKPIIGIKVVSDVIGHNDQLSDYKDFEETKQLFIDDVLKKILKEI